VNTEYWLKRWNENRIGFHKDGVNPLLEQFLPLIAKQPGRTLVPLCGKSADLAWLVSRGHDVVGVDLSDIAARSFASEQEFRIAGVIRRLPSSVANARLLRRRFRYQTRLTDV
jgi:thiopurine S-methyltransferase